MAWIKVFDELNIEAGFSTRETTSDARRGCFTRIGGIRTRSECWLGLGVKRGKVKLKARVFFLLV